MVKAIIFDFDGVIIESAGIKTEAFRKLFCDYPDLVDEIVAYHLKYQGISRYVKFRHIYKDILKKGLTKDIEEKLGRRFSELVLEEVLKAPFVAGAKKFLEENNGRFQLFVASGTPEGELLDIVSARGLTEYFKGIYGSPKEKADIIRSIRDGCGFSDDEIVYIGDSESDLVAAEKAGVAFIERDARALSRPASRRGHPVVRDLTGLEDVVIKLK